MSVAVYTFFFAAAAVAFAVGMWAARLAAVRYRGCEWSEFDRLATCMAAQRRAEMMSRPSHIRFVPGDGFDLLRESAKSIGKLKADAALIKAAKDVFLRLLDGIGDRIVLGDIVTAPGADEVEYAIHLQFSADEKLFLTALRAGDTKSLHHVIGLLSVGLAAADEQGAVLSVKGCAAPAGQQAGCA